MLTQLSFLELVRQGIKSCDIYLSNVLGNFRDLVCTQIMRVGNLQGLQDPELSQSYPSFGSAMTCSLFVDIHITIEIRTFECLRQHGFLFM
jgi:hypothetical protein